MMTDTNPKDLLALIEALKDLGQITVVAPSTEKSACGHSLTLTRPLSVLSVSEMIFTNSMTELRVIVSIWHCIRCLKIKKPDLVISGINKGSNMGEDITYSGTAAAAMEASIAGYPLYCDITSDGFYPACGRFCIGENGDSGHWLTRFLREIFL